MADTPTQPIPDQDDVLAVNERLQADNTRLTAELRAATDLLDTAQTQLTGAQGQADRLQTELDQVRGENVALTARVADFNKAVATEVTRLGLRPQAVEHQEPPSTTDLTPTQQVLAAKGVSSIRELSPKLNP